MSADYFFFFFGRTQIDEFVLLKSLVHHNEKIFYTLRVVDTLSLLCMCMRVFERHTVDRYASVAAAEMWIGYRSMQLAWCVTVEIDNSKCICIRLGIFYFHKFKYKFIVYGQFGAIIMTTSLPLKHSSFQWRFIELGLEHGILDSIEVQGWIWI